MSEAREQEYEEWGGGTAQAGMAGRTVESDSNFEARDDMEHYDEEEGGGRAGIFTTGLALGLAVGSIVALLFAPQSGERTRRRISRRATALGSGVNDHWEDLRDELDRLTRKSRRRVRRGLERGQWTATRSRWRAEDLMERGRNLRT